jgi:hypothetical protein
LQEQLRRFRVPTDMKEAFVAWMVRNPARRLVKRKLLARALLARRS